MKEVPIFFDGQTAIPHSVRLVFWDNYVSVFKIDSDVLLQKIPFEKLQKSNETETHISFQCNDSGTELLVLPLDHAAITILKKNGVIGADRLYNRLSKWRIPALVLGIVVALGLMYWLVIQSALFIGPKLFSPEQEQQYQERILSEVLIDENIDKPATRLLNSFVQDYKWSKHYAIKFTVIDSEVKNAFATLGGNIIVTTGILEILQSPEELMALLGHEAAHINQRHPLKGTIRNMAGTAVVSVILGGSDNFIGEAMGKADLLTGLKHSRAMETEADQQAIQFLQHNELPVYGLTSLFKQLQAEEKAATKEEDNPLNVADMIPSWLSTHPNLEERIARASKVAATQTYINKSRYAIMKRKFEDIQAYLGVLE